MKKTILFLAVSVAMLSCEKEEIAPVHEHDTVDLIYEIGPWNMDQDINTSVVHVLDVAKVKSLSVIILNDDGIAVDFMSLGGGAVSVDSVSIWVGRLPGSPFDDETFDDATQNRGFITVKYAP